MRKTTATILYGRKQQDSWGESLTRPEVIVSVIEGGSRAAWDIRHISPWGNPSQPGFAGGAAVPEKLATDLAVLLAALVLDDSATKALPEVADVVNSIEDGKFTLPDEGFSEQTYAAAAEAMKGGSTFWVSDLHNSSLAKKETLDPLREWGVEVVVLSPPNEEE